MKGLGNEDFNRRQRMTGGIRTKLYRVLTEGSLDIEEVSLVLKVWYMTTSHFHQEFKSG